jgi:hypothetical protein
MLGGVTQERLQPLIDARRGGKALELRATTSLGRFQRDTDRRDEARTILADTRGNLQLVH